jgi:hypothetical protein
MMYEIARVLRELVPLLCVLGVCGFPASLVGLHLLMKHRERMRLLDEELARRDGTLLHERDTLHRRLQALETMVAAGALAPPPGD